MKKVKKHSLLDKQYNVLFDSEKYGEVTLSYGKYIDWMFWFSNSHAMYAGKKTDINRLVKEIKAREKVIKEYVL